MKTRIERRCLLLALALAAGACTDDAPTPPDRLTVSGEVLILDKSGLTELGAQAAVEVTSDAFWLMTVRGRCEWLTVTPMAAAGSARVTVTAAPNPGAERTAELILETQRGSRTTVTVRQRAATERTVYLRESFGTGAAMTPVEDFDAWETSGTGTAERTYTGKGALIDAGEPSAGYDGASGANGLLLAEAGSRFIAGPVSLRGGIDFRLRLGACFPAGASTDDLRMEASKDAKNWTTLPGSSVAAGGWTELVSRFYVDASEVTSLYVRFTARTPGIRIDDIALSEGEPAEGELLEWSDYVDDGKKVGHVYFEDRFDWVTADFGGTDFIGSYPSATAEMRFDLVKDPALKDILDNSGWTTSLAKGPVYLRLGYIKLGKTRVAGDVLTPALGIAEGASVRLTVTFDAAMMEWKSVQDLDGLLVEAVGGGTVGGEVSTSQRLDVGSWNAWKTLSVEVCGATARTRIRFASAWTDADMSARNKSNRFFLDNVKVSKAPLPEE